MTLTETIATGPLSRFFTNINSAMNLPGLRRVTIHETCTCSVMFAPVQLTNDRSSATREETL